MKRRVLCALLALLTALPLLAQSSPPARPQRPTRPDARPTRPNAAATPAPAPRDIPAEPKRSGPGVAEPPAQGYVPIPESPAPGSAAPFAISDPLGVAYWELYDRAKTITLTGMVTKVDWTNPNSYIFLDASGATWAVESSLIQFRQAHVSPAVRVGETITVAGYLPKDQPVCPIGPKIPRSVASYLKDSHLVRAGEITTVFGQKLSMGRPPTDAESEERQRYFSLGC